MRASGESSCLAPYATCTIRQGVMHSIDLSVEHLSHNIDCKIGTSVAIMWYLSIAGDSEAGLAFWQLLSHVVRFFAFQTLKLRHVSKLEWCW